MNNADRVYISTLQKVLLNGEIRGDRTGTGTISSFGEKMVFDLSEGFPLLTTKRVSFHSVKGELLWFLSGSTDIQWLKDRKINIWNGFAHNNSVGRMYGSQWRSWQGNGFWVDQIAELIDNIKHEPDSRRLVVSAWNAAEMPVTRLSPSENVSHGNPALPPCHAMFQCYVDNNDKLSLQLYQRSADMFLGVPFNIASYSLLAHMIAQVCDLDVGKFVWVGGDCHIYTNHKQQVLEQIDRFYDGKFHVLPSLRLNKNIRSIDDFTMQDIEIENYKSEPAIKAPLAI